MQLNASYMLCHGVPLALLPVPYPQAPPEALHLQPAERPTCAGQAAPRSHGRLSSSSSSLSPLLLLPQTCGHLTRSGRGGQEQRLVTWGGGTGDVRVSLEELRWKRKSSVGVSNTTLKSGEGGPRVPAGYGSGLRAWVRAAGCPQGWER